MNNLLYLLILLLGAATYISAVWQMLSGSYSPSFFSRGVWFLLGINSFAGVLLGGGSKASTILAGALFLGNAVVFAVSYKKGSREFGLAEKISLALLVASTVTWLLLDAPFLGLVMSLVAHFIGGIPTIWRVAKRPHSEQAYHWYFFFSASILSIVASDGTSLKATVFPIYFASFDGLIILLANRRHFTKTK
ncbi:MAG: hypothetical protein AAB436_01595 [Patescibacteria group bacterium]